MNDVSNRTLLEINHDFAGEIQSNPTSFANALLSYLRSGSTAHGVEHLLSKFGVTIGPMRHHSEPDPLSSSSVREK